ncbi:S-layer homology domain-containing protein [Paenibacillus sp. GP183]|nr:S-layer homology domain-containing protein [Paenibacillus sp. GP183]
MILVLGVMLVYSQSVFAFSDIQGDPAEAKIIALQKAGIISGMDDKTFDPKGKVTIASGVQMLVKGLDLNLDRIRFIKEPKASDSFDYVPDDAWFAPFMIAAIHNGIPLAREVQPQNTLTREAFAAYLFGALTTKVNYVSTMIWVEMKDQDEISKDKTIAVQELVKSKIASLENGSFRPKAEITRSEAADMLYNTIQFIKDHPNLGEQPIAPAPGASEEVNVTSVAVNAEVNKIVLSRGTKPNAGYGIKIVGVDFTTEGQATIRYSLQNPEPDHLYAQVLTEPKAETYVSSAYKVTAKQQ